VKWKMIYTKQAQKDAHKLKQAGLKDKALDLLKILQSNPLQTPPPFEILVGDLSGAYSRRINIQHRIIYQIYKERKTIKIVRMWTHYE